MFEKQPGQNLFGWQQPLDWTVVISVTEEGMVLVMLSQNDKWTLPTSGLAWIACLCEAKEVSQWNPAHLTPLQTGWSHSTAPGPVAKGLKHTHTHTLGYEEHLWVSEICMEKSLTCSPDTHGGRWVSLKNRLMPFSKNGVDNHSFRIRNHTLYFIHWRTPWICLEEKNKIKTKINIQIHIQNRMTEKQSTKY